MNSKLQQLTRLMRPQAADAQRVRRFEQRLRAWAGDAGLRRRRAVQSAPEATNDTHTTSATAPVARPLVPVGKRRARSLEQLYDEVDAAHVVRLHHFHQFLDAKQILLEARQATEDEEDGAAGAAVATPPGDGLVDAGDPLVDAAGWNEEVDGGSWEDRHAENV